MPAVSSIALAVGAAAALAGTAATINNAQDAKRAADQAATKQEQDQNTLMTDAQKQKDGAESQANASAVRDQAIARQNTLNANAGGRSSTILTSPLGATDPAVGANKSLLGS